MAENTYKSNAFKKPEKEKKSKSGKTKSNFGARFNFDFLKDPRLRLTAGFFLLITAIYLFIAFLSYLFTGKADQSLFFTGTEDLSMLDTFLQIRDSGLDAENWFGHIGALTSHYFVFKWLGISAFFIPPLLFLLGFKMVFQRELVSIFNVFIFSVFAGLWISLLLGYITHSISGVTELSFLSGGLGYELAKIANDFWAGVLSCFSYSHSLFLSFTILTLRLFLPLL